MTRLAYIPLWTALAVVCATAQQPVAPATPPSPPSNRQVRLSYVLGPGDQITIRAFQFEEISSTFRVDSEGDVNLPMLGKIHVGGLTVEQVEADLTERSKAYVKEPQVVITVTEYRSEPVFVSGAFKQTGIIPLQGGRTLLEILTLAGGVQPNASSKIKVIRHLENGPIPLPNAVVDPERKVSTVEISIGSLRDSLNPAENIVLKPLDTISVDKAEMVYVNGEVNKVGGVELVDRDSISITKLIAMVGGLAKDAAPAKARILRPVLNTSRRAEIPVDLKRILAGKDNDFPLLPNDVLYVPSNSHAAVLSRVGIIAIPATSALIYILAQKL